MKFEFRNDRSINVGAEGVEIFLLPLTRLIAYTTACCCFHFYFATVYLFYEYGILVSAFIIVSCVVKAVEWKCYEYHQVNCIVVDFMFRVYGS